MTAPGDVVGGRYVLRGLLARGGMADVYRAHDVVGNRPVAVKAFRGEPSTDTDALRFEREAQLLAELDHPNLVELLDAGHHDEAPYLVLELVNGPTLSQRLGDGPLAPDEARQIGCDVARALAYVHTQGVVHRDVKPSNILLHGDGRALLSDFGIAQSADGTRLTAAQSTIGTAAYLAPEQIGGQPVTGAADVYSLGLVLVESLAGRRPFQGTQHEIVAARLASDPRIPPTLPPAWEQLVQAMTRRDPAARPEAALIAEHLATALGAAPSQVDDLYELAATALRGDPEPAMSGEVTAAKRNHPVAPPPDQPVAAMPDESGQPPPSGPIALPGPAEAAQPGPSTAAMPGEPKGALAGARLAAMPGPPEGAAPGRSTTALAGRPDVALARESRAGVAGRPEAALPGQSTAAMPSRAEAALPGQDTAAMPGQLAAALVGQSAGGVRRRPMVSDPPWRERGRTRRWPTAALSPPMPSPRWLAALVAAAVLAVVFLLVTRGGGTPRPDTAHAESSDTTATPSSTAIAATAAPPAADPATPTAAAATEQLLPAQGTASLTATCADLDAQKQALDDEKHQINETYRHDRETRQALRDDLDTQKQALDDQKQALGC